MSKIINSYVIDNTNIGDLFSAPYQYFEFPGYNFENIDIRNLTANHIQGKHVIIGGGGLAFSRFLETFQVLSQQRTNHANHQTKLIIWGIGQQIYHDYSALDIKNFDYTPYTEGFDLVGIRDYHYGNWVPCASCMHPSFDKKREVKHEFVVFSHKKFQIEFPPFPRMTNCNQNLEEILDFLGSGETILTSSYHGAYWGTLLGRKVLAFPFTSKFYTLKHLPGIYPVQKWFQAQFKVSLFGKTLHESFYENKFICHHPDWREFLKKSQTYPESLAENRDRNRYFYEQVMDLLNS